MVRIQHHNDCKCLVCVSGLAYRPNDIANVEHFPVFDDEWHVGRRMFGFWPANIVLCRACCNTDRGKLVRLRTSTMSQEYWGGFINGTDTREGPVCGWCGYKWDESKGEGWHPKS